MSSKNGMSCRNFYEICFTMYAMDTEDGFSRPALLELLGQYVVMTSFQSMCTKMMYGNKFYDCLSIKVYRKIFWNVCYGIEYTKSFPHTFVHMVTPE